MKKALIVLLILAVAGGLFAQQFSFKGTVNAGLGWIKAAEVDDNDDTNNNAFGLIANDQAVDGVRALIDAAVTNDAGTAGLNFRIRASANPTDWVGNFQFNQAYGWLTGFNGMVKGVAGYLGGTDFDSFDPISDGMGFFANPGLLAYISPVSMFKVGVGAHSQQALGADANVWGVNGFLGLAGGIADLFEARAQFHSAREDIDALLSVKVSALSAFPIEATVRLDQLNEFGDAGVMTFYEHVGINLIENLGLNVAALQSMNQTDGFDDMTLRLWAWATYTMGNIIPRVDFNFVKGATFNPNAGLNVNYSYNDALSTFTWNGDQTYLTVSPSVKFQVGADKFVNLGYLLGMDMSDTNIAIGGDEGGISHAAYVDFKVAF